jgi:hypothetical protein
MHGKKASFLGGHELLCVHCVSKQPLIFVPEGLPCDELECGEGNVYSFTDSSKKYCPWPAVVNGIKFDEIVR